MWRHHPIVTPSNDRRRQRRKNYGSYPQVSLAEFRRLAQIDKGMLAKGQDPQPELPSACTPAQAAALDKRLLDFFPHRYSLGTFGELAALYLRRCTWVSKKTSRHDEAHLTRDLLPRWRDTPLADITRVEVVRLLDEIVDRGAPQLSIRTKDGRTHVSMLGFPGEIGEISLNNSKKGVAAIYNRNPYERQKREALTAWAAKITRLTLGLSYGSWPYDHRSGRKLPRGASSSASKPSSSVFVSLTHGPFY
jgi:hypothetical protein